MSRFAVATLIFALGVIGFLVGGELQLDTFRKYGRQFTAILLGEGIASFVLVATAATLIIYLVYPHFYLALAGGLVLGAIASATDPASTIDVLWEYRCIGRNCRGPAGQPSAPPSQTGAPHGLDGGAFDADYQHQSLLGNGCHPCRHDHGMCVDEPGPAP